jgi:hypothetical protein
MYPMAFIRLLDNETINKIAAGEVIESPKSIVKELAENSIDAGADEITVEIKNGGKTLIRVTDNGKGGLMAAKQLITKEGGTYGFTILYEMGRLDLSVEAHVLKPEYAELFTEEEKRICRERLKEYGYKG